MWLPGIRSPCRVGAPCGLGALQPAQPQAPPEAVLVSGVCRGEVASEAADHQPTLWSWLNRRSISQLLLWTRPEVSTLFRS